MSYTAFLKELNSLAIELKASNKSASTDYEDLLEIIRDRWISAGRFEALTEFILENWNEGNCDKFIAPLEPVLMKQRPDLYKGLWNGIIARRVRMLKDWVSQNSLQSVHLAAVESKDTSSFIATNRESYSDPILVTAYYRSLALEGISKFETGLRTLNASKELDQLRPLAESVEQLWKHH